MARMPTMSARVTGLLLLPLLVLSLSAGHGTDALPRSSFFLPPNDKKDSSSGTPFSLPATLSSLHNALLNPLQSLLAPSARQISADMSSSDGSISKTRTPAPACNYLSCPPFRSVHSESDFEIRRYREATWTETDELLEVSFQKATVKGFHRLFQYIQGDNEDGAHIPMTAPVLTAIKPSAGPFCSSAFVVRFFLPPSFSDHPPKPKSHLNLETVRFAPRCVAVRQFSGFATDFNVAQEALLLARSLNRTKWANVTAAAGGGGGGGGGDDRGKNESYAIAQYNSPFEVFSQRVNEVWVEFEAEEGKEEECDPAGERRKAADFPPPAPAAGPAKAPSALSGATAMLPGMNAAADGEKSEDVVGNFVHDGFRFTDSGALPVAAAH